MADTENRGFLLQEDFAKALRLIGQYQANHAIVLRNELALSRELMALSMLVLKPDPNKRPLAAGPLPQFEGVNMSTGVVVNPTFPPPGIPVQHSGGPGGPVRVPPLTQDRNSEYGALFERSGAQNGFLSGGLNPLAACMYDSLADRTHR
jgi:epidermal growth factor receptor substrate 15